MRRDSKDNKTAELSLNFPSCKKQQLMIYVPGKRPRHNSLDTYFAGVPISSFDILQQIPAHE